MILVVEDNPSARQLLSRMLSNAGHEVIESADGDEALRLLDARPFDLVITDLAMPKTTGFGLISHIRLKWPRLPIILFTGYLSPKPVNKSSTISSNSFQNRWTEINWSPPLIAVSLRFVDFIRRTFLLLPRRQPSVAIALPVGLIAFIFL